MVNLNRFGPMRVPDVGTLKDGTGRAIRELGDQDAPDQGDNGADAVPGNADDARPPRDEVVHDAAARRASAIEYRQRVAGTYAAHDAEVAVPSGKPEDSWPPSRADQDRVRELYREYLADMASAVMVAGIVTVHVALWIDDNLRHGKGDHDDSNR